MAGKQANTARCSIKAVALGVSLVLSALLTAATLRSPDLHWLAWFSFLPLFVVVRQLRPMMAALTGGLWGACLYLFAVGGVLRETAALAPATGPSAGFLALLIVVPAVYVGLAARPARAIGFQLLMLVLGWILVEVVLHFANPSGRHDGLLTDSRGEGSHLHWLARLIGYVATAFLVACANASLVGVLGGTRVSLPVPHSLDESCNVVGRFRSQVILAIQSWILYQASPRAPPRPVAVVTRTPAGSAR